MTRRFIEIEEQEGEWGFVDVVTIRSVWCQTYNSNYQVQISTFHDTYYNINFVTKEDANAYMRRTVKEIVGEKEIGELVQTVDIVTNSSKTKGK